jgi:iron(III) transport system permease protein
MGFVRRLGRWVGTALGVVVLAQAVALAPAALLDRGPGGDVRATLFPAALAAFDPFLWDCARNSLVAAVAVTFGSLVLGVGLAWVVVRWRFWGRAPLTALVLAAVVVPPAFSALGLRMVFGPSGPWHGAGSAVAALVRCDARWLGFVWAGLSVGVPLVASATARALARVEPAWEDAARLVGAGRARVAWEVVWPLVRPASARASAAVFTLTVVEPGAPLVLGLRRTLAFQTVEAALGPDPAPRAALLALAALGYAGVARLVLRWWGGPWPPVPGAVPVARPARTGPTRAGVFVLLLGAGGMLLWLPALALAGAALSPSSSTAASRPAADAVRGLVHDPVTRRLIGNSLALGVSVVGLDLALAWAAGPRGAGGRAWRRSLTAWPGLFPPLAVGVGALVLPRVAGLGADWVRGLVGPAPVTLALRNFAEGLDPYQTPGLLLVLAVAAVRAPGLSAAVRDGVARYRPELAEAAANLGAGWFGARRAARVGWLGASTGALALTFALAATNLTPALLLGPTADSRTVAPAVLILAEQPGDGLRRAAVLATCAIALNLFALAVAARDRGGWRESSP